MIAVERQVVAACSAERAFSVVNDIEAYPQFVRGCQRAEVLERAGDELTARLDVVVSGVARRLVTRNRSRTGREIDMRLVSGPVRELRGLWRFEPLSEQACRIALTLRFAPSGMLVRLVGRMLAERAADRALDDFLARLHVPSALNPQRQP